MAKLTKEEHFQRYLDEVNKDIAITVARAFGVPANHLGSTDAVDQVPDDFTALCRFTGPAGSGKTTRAQALFRVLVQEGFDVIHTASEIDGDAVYVRPRDFECHPEPSIGERLAR